MIRLIVKNKLREVKFLSAKNFLLQRISWKDRKEDAGEYDIVGLEIVYKNNETNTYWNGIVVIFFLIIFSEEKT